MAFGEILCKRFGVALNLAKDGKEVRRQMAWRRVLETQEFVVEAQEDAPALARRFRVWRHQSPFAEVTVRVDFPDEAGNSLVEEIIIQPIIVRRRRNPAVSAALDPQELLRVVWETLPFDLRR